MRLTGEQLDFLGRAQSAADGFVRVEANALASMLTELRSRRAADLTEEEREAMREFLSDCGESYAVGDGPVPSGALLAVLARLLGGKP